MDLLINVLFMQINLMPFPKLFLTPAIRPQDTSPLPNTVVIAFSNALRLGDTSRHTSLLVFSINFLSSRDT